MCETVVCLAYNLHSMQYASFAKRDGLMQRGYLIPTYAQREWDVQFSLPANLSTAMLLVDYAAHGLATPTSWPGMIAAHLPKQARADLDAVRTILAHGAVLREYFLKHLSSDSAAQYEWPALRLWLEHLTTAQIEELINDSIRANLAYYRRYMEPQLEVEQHLERLGTAMPDDVVLANPKQRQMAMQASIMSWGSTHYEPTLALMEHPKQFCAILLELLEALWQQGFSAEWERQKTGLAAQVELARTRFASDLVNAMPDDVLFRLTGRHPTEEWMESLRQAPRIVLVPCAHLGSYLSINQIGDSQYIFYEPPTNAVNSLQVLASRNMPFITSSQALDREALAPVLEALGSATSMTILMILSSQGEMIAQQIAEHADVHQSTISRHFAQLERTGLVLVRRTAGMKFYMVNRQRIHDICQLLLNIFGE